LQCPSTSNCLCPDEYIVCGSPGAPGTALMSLLTEPLAASCPSLLECHIQWRGTFPQTPGWLSKTGQTERNQTVNNVCYLYSTPWTVTLHPGAHRRCLCILNGPTACTVRAPISGDQVTRSSGGKQEGHTAHQIGPVLPAVNSQVLGYIPDRGNCVTDHTISEAVCRAAARFGSVTLTRYQRCETLCIHVPALTD
jgi:hypothetical protein